MSQENEQSQKNDKPSLSSVDQELADNIKHTLDKSLLDIDDETRLQLQQARQVALAKAMQRKKNTQRVAWITTAAAASIAAVIILPNAQLSSTQSPESDDLSYLQVDPQLLEDMDMLMAMGEVDGDA